MILIKYQFIFDPTETWAHLHQFESDLGALFKERGIRAERIETVEGQEETRIVYLSKIPDIVDTPESKSKDKLKAAAISRIDGRFSGKSGR